MGKVWLILFLASIITQMMTLYGFLTNLIGKRGDAVRAIGLGFGASIGLWNIYKWCSEAQKVEDCVSMIYILLISCCEYICVSNYACLTSKLSCNNLYLAPQLQF